MKRLLFVFTVLVICLFAFNSYAAVGDVVADCDPTAASGSFDIRPPGSDEWIIHNITFTKNIEIQRYDGTLTSGLVQLIGPDWQNFEPGFHINNTDRFRLLNIYVSLVNNICYDGIQTG